MKIVFSLLFLVFSVLASATTFYIDPAGSNSNDGSAARPWLTLSFACSKVKTSGDIIHVNSGTYIEPLQSKLAVGVSIEGEGITSIIHSHVTASETPTIYAYSASVVPGNQHISNIVLDGDGNTAWSAIRFVGRSNVKVFDCTIQNFYAEGLSLIHPNVSTVPTTWLTGCQVYNNKILNSTIHTGIGSPAHYYGNLHFTGMDGLLVHHNYMTSNDRAGSVREGECIGAHRYWKNCKIYDNTLEVNVHQPDYFDMTMELFYSMGGNEIYNNKIKGGYIDLCWNYSPAPFTYSIDIYNNTIGTDSPVNYYMLGICLETNSKGVIIRNNHIKNCSHPINLTVGFPEFGEATETIENINIFNNVIESIGNSSDNWGLGISFNKSKDRPYNALIFKNINIWNNVIKSADILPVYTGIQLPNFAISSNISIRNNIIQGFGNSPIWLRSNDYKTGASITNLSIENNVFYKNGQNTPKFEIEIITTKTVQSNLAVNPLFVSTTDFHLQTGSPAINAGINVGLPFSGTAPDIGAFETVSNVVQANQSPVVSISSPVKSASFLSPASITITAAASDPDGTISKVEFFNGTTKLGEKTTVPFSYTWSNVTEGTFSLTAVATDNLNLKAVSAAVSVTVTKAAQVANQLPVIAISSPAKSNTYSAPASINIDVEASDPDGTISKVELFNGTVKVAETTVAPYAFTLKDIPEGSYTLKAVATDNLKAASTSNTITLSVTASNENRDFFNLYPNPNDGRFSIDFTSSFVADNYTVTVFDLIGKTVYRGVFSKEEETPGFDLSHLKAGIYILMISGEAIVTTQKFIKG